MRRVERFWRQAGSVAAAALLVGAASPAFAQSARVAGFRPSKSGFKFANSFASVPYTPINIGGTLVPIGDASNGMCGGMVYTVRDYFEAGMPPPPNTTPPSSGALFNHLSARLFDSFNLPNGVFTYLHLMNPDLPDHETDFSRIGLAPHGRAWVMIVEQWPQIRNEIDHGRLAPLGLIRVKSHDPFQMGQNHQVLAYAYRVSGSDLTIYVYDPNYPQNDKVTISLSLADPYHTTDVTYSTGGSGETMYAFFLTGYGYHQPPSFTVPATKLAGDFNGDGKTDVATAGGAGWNTLPVAFSTGGGAFNVTNNFIGAFASWASDRNSTKLVGDFNGDGKADVALTGPGYWRTIPTAYSYGNGSFWVSNAWVGDFGIWSADPEAARLVGDFNGDGRDDIALTGSPWWDTLPVAFSNGNGTYNVTNIYVGDFASWSSNLEATRLVGDFNGDGRDDIALTGPGDWATVPIAFSNGDGSFYVTNGYVGGFAGWSASVFASRLVGDFNGDGRADIALTGVPWWTSVPVAFSDGAGGFYVTNQPVGGNFGLLSGLAPERVTGDFNGDGRTDIALRPTGTSFSIAYSNANGSFTIGTPTIGTFGRDVFNSPQAMLLKGDFSGDGRTDLALTGPLGWLTVPLATAGAGSFSMTNGWVGDFGTWASEPIL
jgi:hypothetical protein